MSFYPAGSAQKAFLLSLTEKDYSIWNDPNQVRVSVTKRGPERPLYVWDLHALANRFPALSANDPYWHALWLDGFTDDSGSGAYERVPTSFTLSVFNQPRADKFTYTGEFNFSPLVGVTSDGAVETLAGETALHAALATPGMPLLFSSSVPHQKHYGPVFINSAQFRVSGNEQMSPVEINIGFAGGRAITCPNVQALGTVSPAQILPQTINLNDENTHPGIDYRKYRTAALVDCLAGQDFYSNLADLKAGLAPTLAAEQADPVNRIVEMELNLQQSVDFQVVCGAPDELGPRYASINRRIITGSLTYYSRLQEIYLPTTTALTLYFGGPFFFGFQNVEWQKPTGVVKAGNGYLRTFKFIARALPGATIGPPPPPGT